MRYKELRIKVGKSALEFVEAELIENGFTSMMIDDPDDVADILEHPELYRYDYIDDSLTGRQVSDPVITLYFEDNEAGSQEMKRAARVASEIKLPEEFGEAAAPEITGLDAGDDSEWLYKWQEYFKPTKVGERIVVKPTWEEYTPGENDLVIEMDPGMAFGSGLHETTSMCIKALESILGIETANKSPDAEAIDRNSGEDKGAVKAAKVLDVGCGTGILGIAAVLLGADECLGIDIDPDAVRVARENTAKNGLQDRITAQYGDLTEGIDYEADIIVANLMADLVIRLSPAAYDHLLPGGWYITSGILDIKEEKVCEAIRGAGFDVTRVLSEGEWRAVIARKAGQT